MFGSLISDKLISFKISSLHLDTISKDKCLCVVGPDRYDTSGDHYSRLWTKKSERLGKREVAFWCYWLSTGSKQWSGCSSEQSVERRQKYQDFGRLQICNMSFSSKQDLKGFKCMTVSCNFRDFSRLFEALMKNYDKTSSSWKRWNIMETRLKISIYRREPIFSKIVKGRQIQ